MGNSENKIYNLSLTPSSHRAIKILSFDLDMTISEVIQKIIDKYLAEREKEKDKI